jgi:hypothetical protein
MSRRSIDRLVDPKGRKLTTSATSPLVLTFDTTRSMGALPKATVDKAPMVVGQTVSLNLMKNPEISVAGFGDVLSDRAPVQVGDFVPLQAVDDWLGRIWLERGGGGNGAESAAHAAYHYAYLCEMPNAKTPIFILTGDEGVHPNLTIAELNRIFGNKFGRHRSTTPERVFADLIQKFQGNVFMIRRQMRGVKSEPAAMRQWERLLGRERIALLNRVETKRYWGGSDYDYTEGDKSIGDVTVGLIALATGRMTLDEYCVSMVKAREEPQTKNRIKIVRQTLEPIAEFCADRLLPDDQRVTAEEMEYARTTAVSDAPVSNSFVNGGGNQQGFVNPTASQGSPTSSARPASPKPQKSAPKRKKKRGGAW